MNVHDPNVRLLGAAPGSQIYGRGPHGGPFVEVSVPKNFIVDQDGHLVQYRSDAAAYSRYAAWRH